MRTLKFRSYDTIEQAYCPFITDHLKRDLYPHIDVQQWTGLLSKDGVEIYEGDMVEYKAYNIWHRDEVKFTDGKFHGNLNGVKEELQSRYDLGLIVTLGCEVIGNIYEHGHLLENESKE